MVWTESAPDGVVRHACVTGCSCRSSSRYGTRWLRPSTLPARSNGPGARTAFAANNCGICFQPLLPSNAAGRSKSKLRLNLVRQVQRVFPAPATRTESVPGALRAHCMLDYAWPAIWAIRPLTPKGPRGRLDFVYGEAPVRHSVDSDHGSSSMKAERSPKPLTLRWAYARHIRLLLKGGFDTATDEAAHKTRQPTPDPRGGLRLEFPVQGGSPFKFLAVTGAGLAEEEIVDDFVVKIYFGAEGARVNSAPMAFATVGSGEPPCLRRTGNKDAAVFGARWIVPESTVCPVREMVWK